MVTIVENHLDSYLQRNFFSSGTHIRFVIMLSDAHHTEMVQIWQQKQVLLKAGQVVSLCW